MATTAAGTPYVESTDTASAYPTTSLSLANRIDAIETAADGRLDAIEANGWVTSARIADGTIATGDLADSAVTTPKLADGAVTGTKCADATITTREIAPGAVWGDRLLDSAVTTAKIADDAVTPAKISVPILSSGLYLPGTSGSYVSAPDAASLDITGDIDLRVQVALNDWTPASVNVLMAKLQTAGQFSWYFYVGTDGKLVLIHYADGTTARSAQSTVGTGLTDGTAKWVRATLDVDNGSSGRDVKFWMSDDGSSWTQLGTTVTTSGTSSIYSGTSQLEIGSYLAGGGLNAAGKFYRAQVYNGIGGTLVADADFRLPWSDRHRDSAGNTWTLNGSAWAWTVEAAS